MTTTVESLKTPRHSVTGDAAIPLAVDMDGTLLLTDVMFEAVACAFFQRPFTVLLSLLWLLRGRAAFKRRIHAIADLDVATLPVRMDLLAFLREEKARGRELYLVSAADSTIVKDVASRFADVFDGAQGSESGFNLKSRNKLKWLTNRFPDGFSYAGDSRADQPVWRGARTAILAGASNSVVRQMTSESVPIERVFSNPPTNALKVWLKSLRLHQWAKNVLVFVPLLLSQRYVDPGAVLNCVIGFVLIGLVASATYMINDLSDLSADRRHRTKRNRPLASGAMPISHALTAAPLMIGAGLAASYVLSPAFAITLVAYLVTTLTYSLRLKRLPVVDTVALSALYTLRLIMGTALAAAVTSPWLITFSVAFFLAMSLAKRHIELVSADQSKPSALIPGRGYQAGDWPLTLALGTASSMSASLILSLYVMEDAFPSGVYPSEQWLWILPIAVTLFSLRIWLLAHRGKLDDDPVEFAVKDPLSIMLGVSMVAGFGAAVLL